MNLRVNNLGLMNLSSTTKAIARSLERLSTGQRINRPSDDPAGYALSVRLESQVRGLSAYAKNLNQSIGMVETAQSALQTQMEIVQRMRELAVQAASGTLSGTERNAIQTELQSLGEEFRRISQETEFNGHRLLDGSFAGFTLRSSSSDRGIDFDLQSSTFNEVFSETAATGAFSFQSTFAGGTNASNTKTGDFNGDGRDDMVVIGASVIRVFFGNGTGGFSSNVTFAAHTENQIIVADVNNDGKDDIIGSSAADTLRAYTYSGGTFTTIGTISLPSAGLPYDLSVGDIDQDGNIDLVVADSTNVSILLGDGSGGFTAVESYAFASSRSVELADFDGDGRLDFVTANYISGEILVYLGDGTGNFAVHSTYSFSGNPSEIAVGDFNEDGLADLAVNQIATNQLVVFQNNGDSTFSPVQTFTEGLTASIQNVDFVDFDNDGHLDLIYNVANQGLGIYYGNGLGQFSGRQTSTVTGKGESTNFKVTTGGAAFTSGTYVSVFTPAGQGYAFWFSVDGGGSAPLLPYSTFKVNISSADSASNVANKLSAAMNAAISADFTVDWNFVTDVTVSAKSAGNTTNAVNTAGANITESVTDGESDRAFSGIRISAITTLFSYGILDLDQDGNLDIVANVSTGGVAHVYLQNTLTAPQSLSVSEPEKAERLISTLDEAIERIKEKQASLGALHSRINLSRDTSLLMAENFEDARARVMNADLSLEVADLVANQIRQQAALAVQVQQNLSLQMVLSLLPQS